MVQSLSSEPLGRGMASVPRYSLHQESHGPEEPAGLRPEGAQSDAAEHMQSPHVLCVIFRVKAPQPTSIL